MMSMDFFFCLRWPSVLYMCFSFLDITSYHFYVIYCETRHIDIIYGSRVALSSSRKTIIRLVANDGAVSATKIGILRLLTPPANLKLFF